MNLLIDTDILIAFLRGDKKIRSLFQIQNQLYYSIVTRKELLCKQGLRDREKKMILTLLGRLRLVPIDEEIATLAEILFRRYHPRGLEIPDALIAATAIHKKFFLATFNQKHFRFVEGLVLFPME